MCVPVASLIGGETADHSVGSIVGLRHLTTVPSATFRQVGREALQSDMDVRRGDVRARAGRARWKDWAVSRASAKRTTGMMRDGSDQTLLPH